MNKYQDKHVLIVGLGISGVAVAKYMAKQGARITVSDIKPKNELAEHINSLTDLKIEYELGKHNPKTFQSVDLIVLSPGIPTYIEALEVARAAGVEITSEIEIACETIEEPIVAITGTNGKTTTTALIGEMFRADGKTTFVGGNIGRPLLDYVIEGQKADFLVVELSSFQLELVKKMKPAAAVFTNMADDHQDRYPSFEHYLAAKRRLLEVSTPQTQLILNRDNPTVASFANQSPSPVNWFTLKDPMKMGGEFAETFRGSYLANKKKMISKVNGAEEEYDLTRFRLIGEHNRENLLAATTAARSMGVSSRAIQTVIDTFKGVPHRLEYIRRKDGVYFFNDSKGTNVLSVKKSLEAFGGNPVILIAGGKDKNSDFSPLVDLVEEKCKILILLGEAKEKINRAIGDCAETYLVGTFEEAILLAYQKSRSGDVILLSPGCASYDMFRNFEERGDYFRKLVSQL